MARRRSPLKVKAATIRIVAYTGLEMTHIMEVQTKQHPATVLLEFMFETEDQYPNVNRYEMTIAY